jgi:tetraacyldisaccharide 4'-kinase
MNKVINYLESIISGEKKGIFPSILRIKLMGMSYLTFCVVKLRRWLYNSGILKSKRLPCKIISVGNIIVGGSGKTPTVIAITKLLGEDSNLKIAVVSRGYMSKKNGNAVVSDGNNIFLNPDQAGDEPYLLAQNLPKIPILIGKNRIKSISEAIKKWKTQVVILDDGFQYLKLFHDVDIVTIDSTKPFGFDYLLPRGYLREPISALKNADIIILTRTDQCKNLDTLKSRLKNIAPNIPIFESIHQPVSLIQVDTNNNLGLDYLKDKKVLAVCGIANHVSFFETLKSLNPKEIIPAYFADHHKYTNNDFSYILGKFTEAKADLIVTTEKDAQKLMNISFCAVLILKIELKLISGEFMDIIKQKCNL